MWPMGLSGHLYYPRERVLLDCKAYQWRHNSDLFYQSKTDSLIDSIFQTTIHMYLFMIRVMFVWKFFVLLFFLCLQVTCGYTVTMTISARIQPPKTTVIPRLITLVSGFSHQHTYWLDFRVLFLASVVVLVE